MAKSYIFEQNGRTPSLLPKNLQSEEEHKEKTHHFLLNISEEQAKTEKQKSLEIYFNETYKSGW